MTRQDGFFTKRDWDVLQGHGGMLPWVDYYLGLRALSLVDEPGSVQETPTWFDPAEFATNVSQVVKNV